MKRGDFIKINKGEYKGRKGQIIRRTEGGEIVVLLDLDGDPLTPPIEVKLPANWAKALSFLNMVLSFILPFFYGIRRK